MPANMRFEPLRYDPSFEVIAPDEETTNRQITETMRSISQKTFDDTGHANRAVHAKAHALLTGEMKVLNGLPPIFAQGIFAASRTYPIVLRFSTTPGDILDDSVSLPRGLALKVIGVEGERLAGSEGMSTQDFLMINAPAFGAPDAKSFLSVLKLVAATTDRGEGLKKGLSAVLRASSGRSNRSGERAVRSSRSGLILSPIPPGSLTSPKFQCCTALIWPSFRWCLSRQNCRR